MASCAFSLIAVDPSNGLAVLDFSGTIEGKHFPPIHSTDLRESIGYIEKHLLKPDGSTDVELDVTDRPFLNSSNVVNFITLYKNYDALFSKMDNISAKLEFTFDMVNLGVIEETYNV